MFGYTNCPTFQAHIPAKQSSASAVPVVYLTFDGTGDALRTFTRPVSAYPFTVAIRVRPAEPSLGAAWELDDRSASDVYYGVVLRDSAILTRLAARNTTSQNTDDTSTAIGGAWHSFVAVFASDTSRTLYIDTNAGIATNTTSVTFNGLVDTFVVGASDRTSTIQNEMEGDIRDVRVWSRALSSTEASAFANEETVSSTNLELWWKIDEGTGNPQDSSGNSNHATTLGDPVWGSE